MTILILGSTCSSVKNKYSNWNFSQDCLNPESVYFDEESKLVFVSNIDGEGDGQDGNGHISLLSMNGDIINSKWIENLNAPKGMRAHNGQLWVTDINDIVVIDIKKSMVIKTFKIKEAKFLNDIAISPDGSVYVSDSLTSRIHLIKNNQISTFMEGDRLESPNGLLFHNKKLFVAAWGLTTDWTTKILGRLYSIDIKTKAISYITTKPLGNLDGLEINNNGNFIVSDWVKGMIYEISADGKTITTILDGKKGLADIGYIPQTNKILIPYMLNNSVESL